MIKSLNRALAVVLAAVLPLQAYQGAVTLPEISPLAATRPLRVAVIGAGPAGFYAADALLNVQNVPIVVDLFDKQPTPFGNARAGVAPDHAATKAWSTQAYEKIAAQPGFRFFGNVEFGKDIKASDLTKYYDRVIYATGAKAESKLGIPGEELDGVSSVGDFIGWYNAEPAKAGKKPKDFKLEHPHAVVIGAGPVGLDAARMLARTPAELVGTDVAAKAQTAIGKSSVKDVHVLARRGPSEATFSVADIKEVAELSAADLVVSPEDVRGPPETKTAEFLAEQAAKGEGEKERKVRLHFNATPVEIVGENGKVTGVKVRTAEGVEEVIPAGLVLRAIGFKGAPLPGVPFDDAKGVIPNSDGRVVDPKTGKLVAKSYVAGWAKNGAKSLLAAQRSDAQATVKSLLEDTIGKPLELDARKAPASIVRLLQKRGVKFVSYGDWKTIDRLERERGASLGKTREKFSTVEDMLSAVKNAPTPRSTQGPLYVTKDGVRRPLGYNPAIPVRSLWRDVWEWIRHPFVKIGRVREYMRRVQEHLNEITDDDLRWSLNRFDAFENQEGILRLSNKELVNDWRHWTRPNLSKVGPDDFANSSMSRISIRKLFKQAMDREEPTRGYQWTSSMNLHNLMPRVAHFMGVTLQERVAAIALTGNPPDFSVWAQEEERHGNIMQSVYNLSRAPGQPELEEQGIAVTSPKPGEYSARSMMANRSLAEIGAATGYLVLKGNAKKGSPADLSLEGIFRDEVYHYVLMNAARKWGFGIRGRWARLWNIYKHQKDNPLPDAIDSIVDERKGFSPLLIFEVAYAFLSIDKRVERFLDTISDDLAMKKLGKVYQSDDEVRAAIAKGEHTWTDPFPMEVNPEMSAHDVMELERRFPGRFSFEKRRLKSAQIAEMISRYRENLDSPSYWKRKKGFKDVESPDGGPRLARVVGAPGNEASFELHFPLGRRPMMRITAAGKVIYTGTVDAVSMLRLGKIFAAEDASGLAEWDKLEKDLTPKEIVGRLLTTPEYLANPIPVDDEPAKKPEAAKPAAVPAQTADKPDTVDNRPFKTFMCTVCGYKYSEKDGDPAQGVPPGTRWQDLPATWVCPECGEDKAAFEEDMVEVP
jgi:ferredoxin/flavodoxin---NADP+ reductase